MAGLLALALGAWALWPGGGTGRRTAVLKGSVAAMVTYWLLMAAVLAALTHRGGG